MKCCVLVENNKNGKLFWFYHKFLTLNESTNLKIFLIVAHFYFMAPVVPTGVKSGFIVLTQDIFTG